MTAKPAYHHGNLRRALIDEAIRLIADDGLASLSLRELARRLGVSHAAPAYHFRERRDLLTAIAVDGYERLAASLEEALPHGFLEVGLAYVRFAVAHPVHSELMFRPSLLREDDEVLQVARERSSALLYASGGTLAPGSRQAVGLAGWCLMHGLATLWLGGNLRGVADDPVEAARVVASVTFREPA